MTVRWCSRCVLPDTRPNLFIGGDGVCDACKGHDRRVEVDWDERARQLDRLVADVRARGGDYDCLVPVSGGKDSTWQVVNCLELGLKPLTVSWRPPARTPVGQRNLDNLIRLGVDHIDFSVNPSVERVLMLQAYERLGAIGVPMHLGLFNIPLTVAVRWTIPLVLWGENSATEYAGEGSVAGRELDRAWLARFGVTHGTTAADWVSDELSRRDLAPYFGPSDDELERAGVRAVFLGDFVPWDPERSLEVASAHGFERRVEGPKVGWYDYADIDDDFISLHHHLKWFKFGFTRLFDNLSLEIRSGRMSRDEAIEVLRCAGDETPDDDIARFCGFVGIDRDRYFSIAESFRNLDIWQQVDGRWVQPDFLVEDWRW